MSEWRSDERHRKAFGPFSVVSQTKEGEGTAHLVTLHDGRQVRVLPDGQTTGLKRSLVVVKALTALHAAHRADTPSSSLFGETDEKGNAIFDPWAYLVGALTLEGLEWEEVGEQPPDIEAWLEKWFDGDKLGELQLGSRDLLTDLRDAGFIIMRKAES